MQRKRKESNFALRSLRIYLRGLSVKQLVIILLLVMLRQQHGLSIKEWYTGHGIFFHAFFIDFHANPWLF